jgi:hypothetical protein
LVAAVETVAASGDVLQVVRPAVPGPWAAVVRPGAGQEQDLVELWGTAPWEKKADATFARERSGTTGARYHLSPDGQFLIRLSSFPRLSAQVWSFKQNRLLRAISLDRTLGTPTLLGFFAPDQFLVHWRRGTETGVEVWNANQAGRSRPIRTGDFDPAPSNFAISPDGKLLAVVSRAPRGAVDVGELQTYNLASGKALPRAAIDAIDWNPAVRVAGVAFTPDGKRVAALFESGGQGVFVCWASGGQRPLFQHLYPGGLEHPQGDRQAVQPPAGVGGHRDARLTVPVIVRVVELSLARRERWPGSERMRRGGRANESASHARVVQPKAFPNCPWCRALRHARASEAPPRCLAPMPRVEPCVVMSLKRGRSGPRRNGEG